LDFLRGLLLGCGILATFVGLIWMCQGLNMLRWPADSYMLGDRKWAITGGMTAAAGLIAIWFGRPK
jgi:hypothetical protein